VTSLTGSRLSEWENWPLNTRKPSFLSLCLLAEIYHCPVLDLIDFRDREHLPPAELLALDKTGTALPPVEGGRDAQRDTQAHPATPGTVLDALPSEHAALAGPANARSARRTETFIPALPLPADTEVIRQRLDDALSRGAMASANLEDWDRTVAGYGRSTRNRAAVVLLEDLTADLAELHQAIDRHRSASSLRGLTRVTAQMAGLMCLTLIKVGDRQAFRRWGRTARVAAQEAGDALTCSWVLAEEAYGYYYSDELPNAIAVARHAQELVSGRAS